MGKRMMLQQAIKKSIQITLPVMAGYLFLGLTFGLVTVTSGFERWVPFCMSAIIFSGALQFAAVPLLVAGFNPVGSFLLGITLSARHLFYGIPMLKKYDKIGKTKPFLIFGLTDETFSILSTTPVPPDTAPKYFYFFVTLLDYAYWNIGTALGVMLGNAVSVDLQGLDFALTALFLVLFVEQIKTNIGRKSGWIGLACGTVALITVGKSAFIIVSMVLILGILIAGRSRIDRE